MSQADVAWPRRPHLQNESDAQAAALPGLVHDAVVHGIEWASRHINPDLPSEATTLLRDAARKHARATPAPLGRAEALLRGAYHFGAGIAVLRCDQALGEPVRRAAIDWLSLSQRFIAEGFLRMDRIGKELVFARSCRDVGEPWCMHLVGANAVAHLAHHAKDAGAVIRFPDPFEDVYCKADLFLKEHGATAGYAVQVKGRRGFGVETYDARRDPHGFVRDTFQRLHVLNRDSKVEWRPLVVIIGVTGMRFGDFDLSHDVRNAVRHRIVPALRDP